MTTSRTVLQPPGVPEVPYAQGIDVRGVERLIFVSGPVGHARRPVRRSPARG